MLNIFILFLAIAIGICCILYIIKCYLLVRVDKVFKKFLLFRNTKQDWIDMQTGAPFKVSSKISIDNEITRASATLVSVNDPLHFLDDDFLEKEFVSQAVCHPDDEYKAGYGVRLAGCRARIKAYSAAADHINHKLAILDNYLVSVHRNLMKLEDEKEVLLLEQMSISTIPDEVITAINANANISTNVIDINTDTI